MNLKKNDWVKVTKFPTPRRAQVLNRCRHGPNRWVVRYEDDSVETVKERDLVKDSER